MYYKMKIKISFKNASIKNSQKYNGHVAYMCRTLLGRGTNSLIQSYMVTGVESYPPNSTTDDQRCVTFSRANIEALIEGCTTVIVHASNGGLNIYFLIEYGILRVLRYIFYIDFFNV